MLGRLTRAAALAALSLAPALAEGTSADPPAGTPAAGTDVRATIDRVKDRLEELSGGVKFSGFFDVRAANYRNEPNLFSMGDFELDLAKGVGKYFQVGAALVVNRDGSALTVGFIDFHLLGGLVGPRGSLWSEKGFHVQVGQFDVPFANDWQYFAAKDRESVTAPLTTSLALNGGLNDVGLRVFGGGGTYNYVAYLVRGAGTGNAVGGRVAATPFSNPYTFHGPRHDKPLEVGLSYLDDADQDGHREENAWAVDAEVRVADWRVRGEFVRRDANPRPETPERVVQRAWHVSQSLDLERATGAPVALFARYDRYDKTVTPDDPEAVPVTDTSDAGPLARATLGARVSLFDVAQLKFEAVRWITTTPAYRTRADYGQNSFFAQLVIVF